MSNYLIELSGIHIALMLGYWLFLRNERQYSRMRFYLIASTILSLAIPLIKLPKIPFGMHEAGTVPTEAVALEPTAVSPAVEIPAWNYELLIAAYAVISVIFLGRFLGSVVKLVRLARGSSRVTICGVDIRRAENIKGSFTFFNWIFLGNETDGNRRDYEAIVKHERAHVLLGHSYDIVFFELFKVCFWWIPTAWYINQEIRKIHEYQADAYALRSCDADRYSSILIRSTLKSNGLILANSFHSSSVLRRLSAMEQPVRNVSLWKFGTLAVLFVVLFIAVACREEPAQEMDANDNPTSMPERDIFTVVESQPEFEGGMGALNAYVASELKYPRQARAMGIEGRVDVRFVVEKDGSLSDVKAVKGIGAGCDAEAVRIVQNAPPFRPATQSGKPVRVRMELPVIFKLQGSETGPEESLNAGKAVGDLQTKNSRFTVRGNYADGGWSGTVYDEEGEGLPGVNIVIIGTTKGTTTDVNGAFTIKAEEAQDLNFSFVGYESVRLKGRQR